MQFRHATPDDPLDLAHFLCASIPTISVVLATTLTSVSTVAADEVSVEVDHHARVPLVIDSPFGNSCVQARHCHSIVDSHRDRHDLLLLLLLLADPDSRELQFGGSVFGKRDNELGKAQRSFCAMVCWHDLIIYGSCCCVSSCTGQVGRIR